MGALGAETGLFGMLQQSWLHNGIGEALILRPVGMDSIILLMPQFISPCSEHTSKTGVATLTLHSSVPSWTTSWKQ
eukprot:5996322-Alexandrium_andersonii.AAC.1